MAASCVFDGEPSCLTADGNFLAVITAKEMSPNLYYGASFVS